MSQSIWRRHLRGWLPPLLVFLIALSALLFYRFVYADEELAGGRQIERHAREVERLSEERERIEGLVERLRARRKRGKNNNC